MKPELIHFVKLKYNDKILIRIIGYMAIIHLIYDDRIEVDHCVKAWSKSDEYSKELKLIIAEYNYDTTKILSQDTYPEMIRHLENEYSLSEFEKSERNFPDKLFTRSVN